MAKAKAKKKAPEKKKNSAPEKKKELRVIDWEAIEREYRTGQFSNVELGKRFGVSESAIRAHGKRYNWKKDLVKRVQKGIKERLVRDEVRDPNASDEEIAQAAIERGVEIQKSHRVDIGQSQVVVGLIRSQLSQAATFRDKIEDDIYDETDGDKKPQRRNAMMAAVSIPKHAGVIRDLSVALKNLVGLEREAFNLDEKRSQEGDDHDSIEIFLHDGLEDGKLNE